jgi:6-phosphogluconolactonase
MRPPLDDAKTPHPPLRWSFFGCLSLAMMISGCPHYKHNTPPPTGSVNFVYTANAGGAPGTAAALVANGTTGALTVIAGSPFPAGTASFALAAAPGGKFLYVVNNISGNISKFSINQTTGALTELVTSPIPEEQGVDALAIDPTGKFLYAASGNSGNLYEYSIDSAGALHALATSPVQISPGATASRTLAIDPSGTFLFVTNQDAATDNLYVFTRNPNDGTLAPPAAPVALDIGAHAITADPAGNFVLVASSGSSTLFGNLSVFRLTRATGALTPVPSSPFRTGTDPSALSFDRSGKFVYTANTADATISAFSLNASTGLLTEIAGSPFPSGGQGTINGPTGIAADPSGRFLYLCNASNDISGFQINSTTGALTTIAGSPFPSGGNGPHGIVVVKKN